MQTEILTRPDGRRIALRRMTDNSADRTIVFCHPAPGSAVFDPDPEQTAQRRVSLIGLDRPGYGGSDPMPAGQFATVAAAADDIAWMLDEAGRGPVGVAGWSAGGRVALALAARRPDLVDRVVVCGTPAPNEAIAWIPPEQAKGLEAMRGMAPEAAAAALAKQLKPMAAHDPLAMLGESPADAAALAMPGARERLEGMLATAFSQGLGGLAADIIGYGMQDWGFEPEAVEAKVLLLYGMADPLVGTKHGRWWQKRLANCRGEDVPRSGHLCFIPMWRRALSHLAPGSLG